MNGAWWKVWLEDGQIKRREIAAPERYRAEYLGEPAFGSGVRTSRVVAAPDERSEYGVETYGLSFIDGRLDLVLISRTRAAFCASDHWDANGSPIRGRLK